MSEEKAKLAIPRICPFCGCKPTIGEMSEDGKNPIYWLECSTPGCILEDLLEVICATDFEELNKLILKWNNRERKTGFRPTPE